MTTTVAIVINKDDGDLAFSETFLKAHISSLPCRTVTLVGNPGVRQKLGQAYMPAGYLASRSLIPLSLRWLLRQSGCQTLANQDTKALIQYFRRERVDAVLAEYGPTALSVMEACRLLDIPLIAHFHGFDAYRRWVLEQHQQQYRKLFEQAAAVIGVSQHMCRQLVELGAQPSKLFHNACGAELPKSAPATPAEAPPRFLMVGRLVEKKAPFLALLAFAQVQRKVPNAELTIIGDGPLAAACKQLTKALRIETQVNFRGACSHKDVFDAMRQSRCFIQHSVCAPDGDREGTPVGVVEAMGMGLAVVSTRHGGIQDIIEEGKTGQLVDEYDLAGMAEAMLDFAQDPMKAAQLGIAAREAVAKRWTNEHSVNRLWEIIQTSINGGTAKGSFQDETAMGGSSN